MTQLERQQSVYEILKDLRGLEPLKKLFWSELNYQRVNQSLSRRGWTNIASNALAEDPILFAAGGTNNDFHVIYTRLSSDRLPLGLERPVASRLLRDHPYTLFIFSNENQDRWHFLNIKYDEETTKRRLFRRITIGPEERLRTASERLAMLDPESIGSDLFGLSPLAIQQRHDEAFDVEAVTKMFFEEYKAVFYILQDDLMRQTKEPSWAHDYALQFLNRCMFLYFIQRKGWLGEDKEFLRSFWESYQNSAPITDLFVNKWLNVLFLEAFNKKFHTGYRYFPQNIREALALAPFLNGGLFSENDLDQKYNVTISDKRFEQVFKFLERYNFTIAEDSPLDQEIAVDPEMIGKVYESLVNISEEADERGDAGIFYTPRTEIELMCRPALVDYLSNHMGTEHKSLLYQLIFALEPDEKIEADKSFADAELWPALNTILREITIVDPACGSGSFLVGMLHILDDLQDRANKQLELTEDSYDRKRRIIGQSLYGVDVMDWACHVAELRLWLALIIDAEFSREELHGRREPLLPHFSFKIRCGDSLVQEVGGINLGHIRGSHDIPSSIKARITKFKKEKLKFYNNDPTCEFRAASDVRQEELRLFNDVLRSRQHKIQEDTKALRRKIEGPAERQIWLDGTVEKQSHQMELESAKWRQQLESLTLELGRVERSLAALKTAKDVPFVWDIAFVEIFEGDKGGFDIVIGNPPYVRQEKIAPPALRKEDHTDSQWQQLKKDYKSKLQLSVATAYPKFFNYDSRTNRFRKLDGKSDLYIYFYLHGLSLLNPKGSFCFITSNSWLDVGYGRDLQEFLLKHCQVKLIIDNESKRTFAQADINTIIAILSAPDDRRAWGLDKSARFVTFKVPFESVLSLIVFQEIEEATERRILPEFRVIVRNQRELYEEGLAVPVKEDNTPELAPVYEGNKWGGKYLRAPEIFFTILEKGKGKLIRLGAIAEVRPGCYSGINDFFYLERKQAKSIGIELQFLLPIIRSPGQIQSLIVDIQSLDTVVFSCQLSKHELRKFEGAWHYILWGQKQVTRERQKTAAGIPWPETETVRRRKPGWWAIPEHNLNPTQNFLLYVVNDRFLSPLATRPVVSDRCFHRIFPANQINEEVLAAILNSTLCAFMICLQGRSNLGQGAMKFETSDSKRLLVLAPHNLGSVTSSKLVAKFREMSRRHVLSIFDEIHQPDRRALDEVVFDVLGLTANEREAVYKAVVDLVETRTKKAESLKPVERRRRVEAAASSIRPFAQINAR